MTAVALAGVSKRFGTHVAVESLTLEIPRGAIFGVLGPNGAGKSTTLRMINDIIAPDEGRITILDGLAPGRAAAPHIGFLPEERGLYPKMKVLEVAAFMGELRGLSKATARRNARAWLERLGLSEWLGHRVQDLSKGMQQKAQFAAALVHDPELVILDEPWSGLDPVNADVLRDVVRELAARGRTILLSTHVMEQAEQLCDAVAIIARGRLLCVGALDELKRGAASGRVLLAFADTASLGRAAEVLAPAGWSLTPSPRDATSGETALTPERGAGELLATLLAHGLVPRRFEEVMPTLHQLFVDLVGPAAAHAARNPPGSTAAPPSHPDGRG